VKITSRRGLIEAVGLADLPDRLNLNLPFPRKGSPDASYVETKMNRKGLDKMDLAVLSAPHMTRL